MARPLQLGVPTGTDQESRWRWIENSLRLIERSSHIDTAESITFLPTTDLDADSVQDAIEEVDGKATALSAQAALIGAQGLQLVTVSALSAGQVVTVISTGVAKLDLADADFFAASGFVTSAYSSGSTATFYPIGINSNVSGLTPGGIVYLSTDAGGVTATIPSTSSLRQILGFALSSASYYHVISAFTDPSGLSS